MDEAGEAVMLVYWIVVEHPVVGASGYQSIFQPGAPTIERDVVRGSPDDGGQQHLDPVPELSIIPRRSQRLALVGVAVKDLWERHHGSGDRDSKRGTGDPGVGDHHDTLIQTSNVDLASA